MAAFRAEAPAITLSVDVIARRKTAAKMESQQFYLAIIALPFAYPDEGLVASGDYRGVCILPTLHALAKKEIVRLSDHANVDLVGDSLDARVPVFVETNNQIVHARRYLVLAVLQNCKERIPQGVGAGANRYALFDHTKLMAVG